MVELPNSFPTVATETIAVSEGEVVERTFQADFDHLVSPVWGASVADDSAEGLPRMDAGRARFRLRVSL